VIEGHVEMDGGHALGPNEHVNAIDEAGTRYA
jgi:hypothetical protein